MNKKLMTVAIVIVLLVIIAAGWLWFFRAVASECNPQLPTQKLSIDGNTWTVEMATTMTQRACGLSGREGLGENDGMFFVFGSPSTQNFWMKDMNFPLDMIWISGDKVAGFAQNAVVQPGAQLWELNIYTSPRGVDRVLEVVDGTVAKYNIKVGDTITLSP